MAGSRLELVFGGTPPEGRMLLIGAGASPEMAYEDGTLLHVAAARGFLDIARLLLQTFPGAVAKRDDGRNTALHLAAAAGHAEIVTFLIDAGFDPAEKNGNNRNALYLARKQSHPDVIEILEAYHAQNPLPKPALPRQIEALPEVYPDGFRPRTSIYEDDFEVAAGVSGTTGAGWDWVASFNYGFNDTDWESTRGLNVSLGPTSPTEFQLGGLRSSEANAQLDVTRAFALETGGELQVSFGSQFRRERYEIKEGEEASWIAGTYVRPPGQPFAGQLLTPGAQASPGFQPADAGVGERNNVNVYGELGWSPTERFFLGGALRYENFDDSAGDTIIYKVASRYQLFENFALRGSYNTGFRAPGLAQQTYASTTSQFRDVTGDGNTELLLLKTLPVDSPAAIALGATPLVPEESRNFSFGFTTTPFDNFTLTVDAYQIEIDNRIAISSLFSPLATQPTATPGVNRGQAIQAILVANGLPPEISGQYYTNAIDTRTRGVDVVASYNFSTGFGDFRTTLGYNWNDTEITGIRDNPPELAPLGAFDQFDRNRQSSLTTSIPDSKLTSGINWSLGRYSASVRATRFGDFTVENATNPANDQFQPGRWIYDFELGVALTEQFSVMAGANNATNVYPERTGAPNAFGAGFYNGLAPFGFTGGSWYVRGAYNW